MTSKPDPERILASMDMENEKAAARELLYGNKQRGFKRVPVVDGAKRVSLKNRKKN